jgi:hypothetical protein
MYTADFNNLLKKKMTRKEFLRFTGLLFVSMFGIVGVLRELESHAASLDYAAGEAEDGTLSGGAQVVADSNASGGEAVKFGGGPSYVTGLSPTGSGNLNWFVDQGDTPRFLFYDNPWGIIPNAGRWSSSGGGTWQEDIDNFCSARGAQGFNAVYMDPFCDEEIGGKNQGLTWDNVPPFSNGTASSPGTPNAGLNNTYWQRVDRFVSDCATAGMTAIMNIGYTEGNTGDIDNWMAGFSTAQFTAMGTAIAGRYKNTPNIIWAMGNDYNYAGAPENNSDPNMLTVYQALRAAGDTHVFTFHPYPESDSRRDFGSGSAGQTPDWFGPQYTQYSMMYTYIQTYYGMEYAYGTENSTIPVIWGDGYFYQGPGASFDTIMRQNTWWAIASGARGCISGSEAIWPWPASAPAAVTQGLWYTQQAAVVRSLIESLPNWYKLVPDTSNQLITAGRGTRTTAAQSGGGGRQYGNATSDNYIAGSYVADGSLALIYFSAGCGSNTITINQSKMQSGYTATWVDPTNGNKHAATVGSTYSAGTARGNNATGYADWLLVLQGP